MAKKTATDPRFFEVVFRGKPKVVKAFVKGLMMGADRKATIYFSFDAGVHHEGKAEKLKEMVGIRAVDCHLIVDAEASALLKKLARRIADETGLKITAHRSIRSASMDFEYHAYARQYSDEIVALLKNLPQGLRLRGYKHDEKRNPEARGLEAYSVAHHFEADGSGTVAGRVDLLIAFKRDLAQYPLIKAADIRLK